MSSWTRHIKTVVVPVGTVSIAFLIRYLLDPLIVDDDAPFLLLLAAVMASAYLAGTAAGLLATILGLAAATVFMWPDGKILSPQSATKFEILSFVVEAVVITFLCHALHRARVLAEASAEEAKLLQREVSDAADREQRRIGQDLHDDLGQFLTGVALSGELLARRMEKEASPHTEGCRHLVHMVNESVNRTRQLARGLSPMAVDPDSLPMLLAELQERSAELSGKTVTFDMTGTPGEVPNASVLHLYRIAQEAVSNALKHSNATNIEIELECAPDRWRLSITDDGNGLPKATSSKSINQGMGLRVMQFRAKTIGAAFEIRNRTEGHGTVVVADLKLNPVNDDPASDTNIKSSTVTGTKSTDPHSTQNPGLASA